MIRKILATLALAFLPVLAAAQSTSLWPQVYPSCGGTGCAFSSPLLVPDGTAVAPSVSFASDPLLGWYKYGINSIGYAASGSVQWRFSASGLVAEKSTSYITLYDTTLLRDGAANTLALRNSTNAQMFNIYNTYTDGSNYERGSVGWSANTFLIDVNKAGTGTSRSLRLIVGSRAIQFDAAGNFYPETTDVIQLGYVGLGFTNFYLNRSIQGSKSKALVDGAAAASIVRIAVPQTVGSNFAGGDMVWTAMATDATPHVQSLSGRLTFTAVNNAGTEVCAVDPTAAVTAPNANSSGTLACTLSCASAAADTVDIQATCNTSFGSPTALTIYYRLDMPQPNTVTPQ